MNKQLILDKNNILDYHMTQDFADLLNHNATIDLKIKLWGDNQINNFWKFINNDI